MVRIDNVIFILKSVFRSIYGKYTAYEQIQILLLYKILQYWIQLSSMIHRGEIVEQAVRASGQNLSKLAKRLGKAENGFMIPSKIPI